MSRDEKYSGGWTGEDYKSISDTNERNRNFIPPTSNEYDLQMKITALTLENVRLRNINNELVCENGRLSRTIERLELSK